MDKIKIIKEEDYVDKEILQYATKIMTQCGIEYPLAMVEIDGKKYMIIEYVPETQEERSAFDNEQAYAIVHDENGELVLNIAAFQESRFTFTDDIYSYCMDDNKIERTRATDNFFESLEFRENPNVDDQSVYTYIQDDISGKRALVFFYPVITAANNEIFLNFLAKKHPIAIEYLEKKFKVFTNMTNYALVDNRYYLYKITSSKKVYETNESYSLAEMNQMITDDGFNGSIPEELIESISGQNELSNRLSRVVKIYKENTK